MKTYNFEVSDTPTLMNIQLGHLILCLYQCGRRLKPTELNKTESTELDKSIIFMKHTSCDSWETVM